MHCIQILKTAVRKFILNLSPTLNLDFLFLVLPGDPTSQTSH